MTQAGEEGQEEGQVGQGIGAGRVQIEFVETPICVSVDMALLSWGDLLALQRVQGEAAAGGDSEASLTLLNGLVTKITGQDAAALPAMVVTQVVAAIKERTAGLAAKN